MLPQDVEKIAKAVAKKLASDNPGVLITRSFCNERTKFLEFKINGVRRLLYVALALATINAAPETVGLIAALFKGG